MGTNKEIFLFENDDIASNEPFGVTDAARSRSIEEIEKVGSEGFVNITISKDSASLSNEDIERFRVIIGKKGSGKTLYLRRSYRYTIENSNHNNIGNSIYSEDMNTVLEYMNQTRPQTEIILRFSQLFTGEFLTEKWRELWRRAILRTLVSHILFSKKLTFIKTKLPENFISNYKKILSKSKTPVTIFSQVIEIIESTRTNKEFDRFCNSILWTELDYILSTLMKESMPPLYFYVDAIDEEYQHAPMYWMRCQKGLFYSVMQFLKDDSYGGKLHIIISIRDHVFNNVLQSEHESRYLDKKHISILHWDNTSITYLLEQKLKYLDSQYFVIEGNKTIDNWIGFQTISNHVRSLNEMFIDYLLRHTRTIPRDIIVMGNRISNKVKEHKDKGLKFENFKEEIKEIIEFEAKRIADEQLQICANHLTSNFTPSQAVEYGIEKMYTSQYTAEQEYLNLSTIYKEKICSIISFIGKDRFSYEEILKAKDFAKKIFDSNSDLYLFDILWQNSLIGYAQSHEYAIFYNELTTDFLLPIKKNEYVFHSILIDKLNLKPIGLPVRIK